MEVPDHIVIEDDKWEDHLNTNGVHPEYMRLGVLPNAYYDPPTKTIYSQKSCWETAKLGIQWAVEVYCHEMGHFLDYDLNDHPTAVIPGIAHAIRVGFDVRAFSGILRLRMAPQDLVDAGKRFIEVHQAEDNLL